jgi:hypothetical protein
MGASHFFHNAVFAPIGLPVVSVTNWQQHPGFTPVPRGIKNLAMFPATISS